MSGLSEAAPYVVMLVPLAYADYTRRGAKKAKEDAASVREDQKKLSQLEALYGTAFDRLEQSNTRLQQSNDLVIRNLQHEIERLQTDMDKLREVAESATTDAEQARAENRELRRLLKSMEETLARMKAQMEQAGIKEPK